MTALQRLRDGAYLFGDVPDTNRGRAADQALDRCTQGAQSPAVAGLSCMGAAGFERDLSRVNASGFDEAGRRVFSCSAHASAVAPPACALVRMHGDVAWIYADVRG